MHALLELDCIPAGMELFPAANETQWSLIKRVIDECDYYVLILAGRYGSLSTDGLSYTEMEYRHALSINKPIIAFVHRNPGKIVSEKSEHTPEGREKLAAFRASVEKRLCKHWETPQELGSVVSRSLIQLIKSTPAVGWVRANELADRDATTELLQLRRRVEQLQSALAEARTSAPKGAEALAQGNDLQRLRYSLRVTPEGSYTGRVRTGALTASWNRIFSRVAPLMINEALERQIKHALDSLLEERIREHLSQYPEFEKATLSHVNLNGEDFQTIKVQLRALGLIAKSDRVRSVKDSETYWKLTTYGDEVMTRLLAIQKSELQATDGSPTGETMEEETPTDA